MKFQFNYLENRLWKLDDEYAYEVNEDSQFRTNNHSPFGGDGFLLGEKEFITFNLYPTWIRVFYQQPLANGDISHYRKDIAINWNLAPTLFTEQVYPETIEFALTEKDQVEKINDRWVKKINFFNY